MILSLFPAQVLHKTALLQSFREQIKRNVLCVDNPIIHKINEFPNKIYFSAASESDLSIVRELKLPSALFIVIHCFCLQCYNK